MNQVVAARDSDDVVALTSAAIGIAKVGKERAVPVLYSLASHNDGLVRAAGIEGLGIAGGSDGIPVVVEALDDPYLQVQGMAIRAAARLHARDALPKLFALLDHPYWMISGPSAAALGAIGDHAAIEPLKAAWAKCDHRLARRAMKRAITKLESKAARENQPQGTD